MSMVVMHARRGFTLAATALLVGACTGSATPAPTPPSTVGVNEKEFSVNLDSATAVKGDVTFTVHNQGTVEHEFVVFKTDLAPDKLPLNSEGVVDEESSQVTHLDPEVEDLAPGATGTAVVKLSPGRYVIICNLPGHYVGGMRTTLVVNG